MLRPAAFRGEARQLGPLADPPALEEERLEEPLDERRRVALPLPPGDQPMAVERVRLLLDALEAKREADGLAGIPDAPIDLIRTLRAAELALDIACASDALGR